MFEVRLTPQAEHAYIHAGGLFLRSRAGAGRLDNFFGFGLGTGVAYKQIILDVAYEFRIGTVRSKGTDTSVQQHKLLTSIIYHF